YWHVGLVDRALADLERARALNPSNRQIRAEIGACYLYQTNYAKALFYMTNFPPDYPAPIGEDRLASAYQHLRQTKEAWSVVNNYLNSGRPDPGGLMASMQAVLFADAGEKTEALKKIAQAQEKGKNFAHFHHTTYNIATAYALLNEPGPAMKWLRQTAEDGFPNYVWFQRDPNLDSLRQDPEFIRFMDELEKQWKRYRETL
ncbi:MAG: hypothetical protein HYY23_16025, partial [Verrucomicrobia bacterium]|nr:hypothetical protein [Verrucomicrobiota bacterium]